MTIIKDLDNSTTVVVNEDKNLWWSGLLFLIQTEATKTLLNLHLAAIKKVHALKDNFWSTNSLDIDCFRGQMPLEEKNHSKSMHRKHIVLMIMTPWLAKITFAQNEDPPQHTLPSFLRGQFSVIKHSFDVELRCIREFALRDKRQYCLMHCCYIANFLLWKDTNFSPLWTKDSRCVLIFEFFPSKDVFQGGCSTANFMVE